MANMTSRLVGNTIVALHSASTPAPGEWDAHLMLLARAARENKGTLASCKALVFSDGGMPDSVQRQASTHIIDRLQGKEMPIAIITASAVVRGIVTAGHWFGLKMQAHAPPALDRALAYLDLPPVARERLRRELDAMANEVACRAYADARW